MNKITDYGSLAELLNRSGSPLPLPELHGGLCGVLCASGRAAAAGWLGTLIDDCPADQATRAELARRLESLGNETWNSLSTISTEFAPCLPADEITLTRRTEALGLWCHGFLSGLVEGGLDLNGGWDHLSNELAELVHDFAEISKAGVGAEDIADTEESDSALTVLVQYVRIGAQLIFAELVSGVARKAERTIH